MKIEFENLPLEKYFFFLVVAGIVGAYSVSFILHKNMTYLIFIETAVLWVPIVLAFVLLYFLYKLNFDILEDNIVFLNSANWLKISFVIVYTLSIVACAINSYRPWYYFLLIVIVFSIIFLQIFSKHLNSHIILIELIFTLINLIFSQTLKYPFYVGATDIIDHTSWSQFVLLSGKVSPFDVSSLSSYFPLFQICDAIGNLFMGGDLRVSYFLLNGLIYCFGLLFLYLLVKNSIGHEQIALLTCLLFSTFSMTIYFGTYMVTRSIALVGFLFFLCIYATSIKNKRSSFPFMVLLLIYAVYLLLVHHVSIFHILPLFGLMILCDAIVNPDSKRHYKLLVIFILIVISYWLYVAWTIMQYILRNRLDLLFYEHPTLTPSWVVVNQDIVSDTIFETLKYIQTEVATGIFLFFYFIGVGYILYKKKPSFGLIFSIITILTIAFYIPSPVQGIYQLYVTMGFDRVQIFIAPFMAIMMAFGIYFIIKYFSTINKKQYLVLIVIIFFLFALLSNITRDNAQDSSDLYPQSPSNHFEIVDLAAFTFWDNFLPSRSYIGSDIYANSYVRSRQSELWEQYRIKTWNQNFILDFEDITQENSFFFYRKDNIYYRGGLGFDRSSLSFNKQNAYILETLLNDQNKIYSSRSNELYYTR